jgi:hypothetical protein
VLVPSFGQQTESAPQQELQPITFALHYKNAVYTAIVDPNTGKLECVSDNDGCRWRVTVAERLRSLVDFGAVATPGGPVFIFSRDNQIKYALLHFQSGKTVTPTGNAPLSGDIGPGALESAVFEVGQFGAKATIEAREAEKRRTYRWDINVHGTSKQIEDPVTTDVIDTVTHDSTGITFAAPRGFRAQLSEDSVMFTGPVPGVRMILTAANAGLALDAFTERFLAEFAPDSGFQEESRDQIKVGGALPGYIITGQGLIGEQPGGFMLLIFTRGSWSYVAVFGAPLDRYDAYFDAFPALISALGLP